MDISCLHGVWIALTAPKCCIINDVLDCVVVQTSEFPQYQYHVTLITLLAQW